MRAGRRSHVEPPLSSEVSLQRTLKRLSQLSGSPLAESETIVERRLPGALSMSALTGPGVGGGALIRLERPQRVDATLEDLVRSGTISRAIATFLRHCVAARANVLVVGPKEADTAAVLCALAAAASDGHVVAVHNRAVLVSSNVNVSHVNLAEAGAPAERVLGLVAALPEARLAVEEMDGAIALGTLEAIGAGADGILAVLRGHTARRGLSRLPSELAAVRSGLTPAAAREWLAHAFDVILELAVLRDGRSRVLRVAEPASASASEIQLTDIFNFVIERTATGGSVEGTFQPTGVIPRIVDEMTARGISVSPALFSRPPSR
jgi:pilus assembly protein CpaF